MPDRDFVTIEIEDNLAFALVMLKGRDRKGTIVWQLSLDPSEAAQLGRLLIGYAIAPARRP